MYGSGEKRMSEGKLESLTYKELIRELIKRLDEQSSQIQSLDQRERILQITLERLMGKMEGQKEESGEWKWKLGFATTIILFVINLLFQLWRAVSGKT